MVVVVSAARVMRLRECSVREPLSSEYGACKTVQATCWSWLAGCKDILSCSPFARNRQKIESCKDILSRSPFARKRQKLGCELKKVAAVRVRGNVQFERKYPACEITGIRFEGKYPACA